MVVTLAETQNRRVCDYEPLIGTGFREVGALTKCGETSLRTEVPSQAPVLPVTTTFVR